MVAVFMAVVFMAVEGIADDNPEAKPLARMIFHLSHQRSV
jgi:hypothetical protein